MIEKLLHQKIDVCKNDEYEIEMFEHYDKIVLSPGPGIPSEAGLLKTLIEVYAPSKSILGICLGHQAIGEVFGASLKNINEVFHGVSTPTQILDANEPLFSGLNSVEMVGRYHSWVIENQNLPDCLKITAVDNNNLIMGIRHKTYDIQGVQFHPESILTPCGEKLISNWLFA
jgi:anthranilate synthase component 2